MKTTNAELTDIIARECLIDQLTELDQSIKSMTASLKLGKEQLAEYYCANSDRKKITTAAGNTVVFSVSEVYDPIPVMKLHDKLSELGKLGCLFDCLTVNVTELKKVLGSGDIKELQGVAIGDKVSVRLMPVK